MVGVLEQYMPNAKYIVKRAALNDVMPETILPIQLFNGLDLSRA